MKFFSGSIILLLLSLAVHGQEVLTPANGNPLAEGYYRSLSSLKKSRAIDTLELPFIDDFSASYIEPDPRFWTDNHAFINSSYPVSPVTVGVATLDALDFDGSHYPDASSNPYQADFLTSKPINLNYSASDNIWLSFFYQPQGLGEMPDPQDSLCLDFFTPELMNWENVWSVPGQPLKPFERIMINITEERFLKTGFRFRFRNYASLPDDRDNADYRDNKDHWHIDYVYLNKNRSAADTVLRDVSFSEPLRSILKDYETIPWTHFEQAYFTQRKPTIDVKYANYDTTIRNVTRVLEINDLLTAYKYSTPPTANDIDPGSTQNYSFGYDYPFNLGAGDSAKFLIRTFLKTDAFDYKPNDTISYTQKFLNYYSLDDGTAEAGYGLRGLGTKNASVAVRFNCFREDSLRAVDMYFNQLPDSANLNYYFYLRVWDSNKGKPGNLMYSEVGMRPAYTGQLNGFYRYELDSAIAVKDTIFIGFTQTVEKLINIGFDRNRNNSSRNFYNISGSWINSGFSGTIMIRPVVSMNPIVSVLPLTANSIEFTVYPNPASELVYFKLKPCFNDENFLITIVDMSGRTVLSEELALNHPLNISSLKNGFYLIRLNEKNGSAKGIQKLIINK